MSNQGIIDFRCIKRLNNRQKEQALRFANKLSDFHIYYENQKVNVIISQTLRAELADTIEFLMNTILVEFIKAKPTIKFIRILDALFDYGNSRDRYEKKKILCAGIYYKYLSYIIFQKSFMG